jgi:hypothetical protein
LGNAEATPGPGQAVLKLAAIGRARNNYLPALKTAQKWGRIRTEKRKRFVLKIGGIGRNSDELFFPWRGPLQNHS